MDPFDEIFLTLFPKGTLDREQIYAELHGLKQIRLSVRGGTRCHPGEHVSKDMLKQYA